MQGISFRSDILPLRGKFFRLALRVTLDRAEAEDVVRDTMVRIWNKRDEWSWFKSVEAYYLTVVKNLAIDKSQKKKAQNVELTPEMEEEPDANSPYDQMIHDERMNTVSRLANELPEKQRLIMQPRNVEGEDYERVVGLLNLAEEQVKANLFRVGQKVKQRYLEVGEYGL